MNFKASGDCSMPNKNKTMYITRNGLLEPLGQSQVLSYLRGLSENFNILLITFEKKEDLVKTDELRRVQDICAEHKIRWLPLTFRRKPKYIASIFGLSCLLFLTIWYSVFKGYRLIHARSYIPAAAALMCRKLTGIPFIFDMRALWPEELITAGRLRRNSVLHRLIVLIERSCLRNAAHVVVLTRAADEFIRASYPVETKNQAISIIPTCVDLEHFAFIPGKQCKDETKNFQTITYGCIGSVTSGWFATDWLAKWYLSAIEDDNVSSFDVVTRDDPTVVRALLDEKQVFGGKLSIRSLSFHEMPSAIRSHDLSLMFYAGGSPSELGRSPTRLAEVLACGRPVVVNDGVGDVSHIVSENRVGVILEAPSPEEIEKAKSELQSLMCEKDLAARCRQTAERIFSLEHGTSAYARIYRSLLPL